MSPSDGLTRCALQLYESWRLLASSLHDWSRKILETNPSRPSPRQDRQCQDQDRQKTVSSGLETKTAVLRTTSLPYIKSRQTNTHRRRYSTVASHRRCVLGIMYPVSKDQYFFKFNTGICSLIYGSQFYDNFWAFHSNSLKNSGHQVILMVAFVYHSY